MSKQASLACYKSVVPIEYQILAILCFLNLYRLELTLLLHQVDETFHFLLLQEQWRLPSGLEAN